MRTYLLILCLCLFMGSSAIPTENPPLKVAADGFPAGHDTPEGAACDLVRAFIQHDAALFKDTCVRLYANGKGPEDYAEFLQSVVRRIKQEAESKEPSASGPKSIGKVFAVRRLSKDGPASYGYATYGFQEVGFVDISERLQNGGVVLNRTLVIKDKDGKWYAHPMPDVSPLLSTGLSDEARSTQDFAEVYRIQK